MGAGRTLLPPKPPNQSGEILAKKQNIIFKETDLNETHPTCFEGSAFFL